MNRQTFWQRVKQLLAPVVAAIATAGKWIPLLLKLPMLKVGATMFISLFAYAMIFGWQFAAGFILLLFVHEMGHLIAARMMGLKVGLPVFIPFMGALIALKEAPRNAWIESVVGVGGPLLGSLGALAVASCYCFTGNPLFLALGNAGFFLNLFNLIPIVPLDGGRIVSAVSPWLWLAGLVILVAFFFVFRSGVGIFILFMVILSFPRVIALFRGRSPEEMRYFECTPAQRWIMGLLYFGLAVSLVVGMAILNDLMPPRTF
jgi:Zn-dependent protease